MRFPVRFIVSIAAAAVLALGAATFAQAQSSSSSAPASTAPQPTAAQAAVANGGYISTDPLANVRYDNRYDLSLGMAYDHMKAGANLLQGSNLGGLDISGSYWLTHHWGIEATDRTYVGTSGAGVNSANIKGPFVSEYFFTGGPEWLGPHNKHGALIAHAMFGGVYGDFTKDLLGHPASFVDFYNNQFAPAAIVGGHFDLNRSEHWVFRVTPDAVFTWYSLDAPQTGRQTDVNFAISVGAEYKFTKHKR
jgi:hypothetical protein